MKVCWVCVITLFFWVGVKGQHHVSWQQLWKQEGVKHAAISISVKDVKNGQVIYEHNPGMALRPASVLKLFPTVLSLKRAGDTLTYKTRVYYTGTIKEGTLHGDIRIVAGGDPTLDSRYFPQRHFMDRLVSAIVHAGIKRIEGMVVVEGANDEVHIPGSWPWEDVGNYYAALYHPFNYKDNSYTINFTSDKANTPARVVSVKPSIPGVKLRNEVQASRENRNDAWIFGGPDASTLVIRGTIPANQSSFPVKGAMHHPAVVFQAELENRLKEKGIRIDKKRGVPTNRHELLTVSSPLLKEIVFCTNKNSNNLFAEALGAVVNPSDFGKVVKENLKTMGIDSSGIIIKDACGLSPSNAVPAEVFTDLLIWAKGHLHDSFFASLPQGGVDWGVRIYTDHPSLEGNVRAKTGSMFGVRALSGYLETKKKGTLAFTVLINNYTGNPTRVQELVRDFLRKLAEE